MTNRETLNCSDAQLGVFSFINLKFVCFSKHSQKNMYNKTFNGTKNSITQDHEIKLFANKQNEIEIEIRDYFNVDVSICLDKKTAIKLHRQLKRNISYLKDGEEVCNG